MLKLRIINYCDLDKLVLSVFGNNLGSSQSFVLYYQNGRAYIGPHTFLYSCAFLRDFMALLEVGS
jgi:hypothetical protein